MKTPRTDLQKRKSEIQQEIFRIKNKKPLLVLHRQVIDSLLSKTNITFVEACKMLNHLKMSDGDLGRIHLTSLIILRDRLKKNSV